MYFAVLFGAEAFPLTVNTAAVILAVKVKGFGQTSALRVTLSQVSIEKVSPFFASNSLAYLSEQLMFLPGTDKEGSGEGVKALCQSEYSGLLKSHVKAELTALFLVFSNPFEEFRHIIARGDKQG